jgi:hypothetical protein
MLTCQKCGSKYPEWQKSCPQCGNPTGNGSHERKKVPDSSGSSMTKTYLIAGLIVVIAIVAVIAFVLSIPAAPTHPPIPVTNVPTVKAAEARPMPPSPPPALSALKSGNRITVSAMAGSTLSEVEKFTVTLNGAAVPKTLGTTAGSSITVDAAAGTNTVIVTALYKNGAEMVVLNKIL